MAEITAATAVGWVVSPVIKMVIEKTKSFIEKKYFEKSDIEDGMKKMNTTLLEILSTMAIVEQHRIVDPNQVLLVRQIKDAVYDAEDCMYHFDYELAKEESEKLLPNMVRSVTASWSRVIHQALIGNSILKKKLREVNKSLDQAKASAKTLLELMNANTHLGHMQLLPKKNNKFLKSSVPSEDIFIGRKTEGESIIQWIHEKKAGPPTIIPIVGRGGLGKTTLSQMIFNHPRLNDHFESKLWLSVSDNFDMVELTKQMLKYLCENFSTKDASFDMLQTKLRTELASKKILLILDDLWFVKDINGKYSYEEVLKQFFAPLRNSNKGSTIIVTTREELVVNTLKSLGSIRPIYLDALNDDDGWSLLKLKAFKNLALLNFDDENLAANLDDLEHLDKEIVEKLKSLKPIGKKIVEKLKGLPLAVATVGSRLRGEFDIEEWKRVLKDDSLDNGIMEVLHRSYEHLPAHLQRCFAYCSLFPKDCYLLRDRLVHMWIAQGFVLPNTGERLADVGKSYFSELISRSFIQVIKKGNKEYYVLHDLMNDLACHVSKGECYILKEGNTFETLGSVKHLSVTTVEHDHLVNIRGLDKLRTLILLSDSWRVADDKVFIRMKKLRVLDINYTMMKLPNIGECKLLYYLSFLNGDGTFSELAHEALSKFHLLTVLFIGNGYLFPTYFPLVLARSIRCMSRLEFIDIDESIPIVLDIKKKDWWELSYLRDFNNIKGILQIGGLRNVVSREKAIEAQLGSKKLVIELRLRWQHPELTMVKSNIEHNEILEALRPHPNLKRLEIWDYPGDKFPSWLESNWLCRLTYLDLKGDTDTSGFKMLPALGQFSLLKKLRITHTTMSRIGDEFYGNGIFPSLEELRIEFIEGLKEWSSPRGVRSFPKLRRVELCYCPDLFSLPQMEFFCSLESVVLKNCPKIRSLPKLPVSLRYLQVRQLHSYLKQFCGNNIFPSLEELHIEDMVGLQEWSSPCGVHSFPKLCKLTIEYCPEIRSLPNLPVSLEKLRIVKVHPDLGEQLGNKNGPEWDKVAVVSGCHCEIYRHKRWVVLQEGGYAESESCVARHTYSAQDLVPESFEEFMKRRSKEGTLQLRYQIQPDSRRQNPR